MTDAEFIESCERHGLSARRLKENVPVFGSDMWLVDDGRYSAWLMPQLVADTVLPSDFLADHLRTRFDNAATAAQAAVDLAIYGNAYVRFDVCGRMVRIDPPAVTVRIEPPA